MVKNGSAVKSKKVKIDVKSKKKAETKVKRQVERLPRVSNTPPIPPPVPSPYRTINRTMEEIAVNDITHFTIIPDFITTSIAKHPIVVRTPLEIYCVEAYDLIATAITEGKTTILCEVDEIESHSELEISFRKAGMRTLTRGGFYVYAEIMSIAKNLTDQVKASNEELKLYTHGQRKYDEGFVNNREEDLRYLVSSRMGKDRDTYNTYMLHCEHLSDEVIQTFITRKAPKDFFLKAQVKKRGVADRLIGEGVQDPELTQQVSTRMLQKFEEYELQKEADKEASKQTVTPPALNDEIANGDGGGPDEEQEELDEEDNGSGDPNVDPSANPRPPAPSEEIQTVATIKDTILGVSTRLSTRTRETESLDEIDALLDTELKILIRMKNAIRHLMDSGSRA